MNKKQLIVVIFTLVFGVVLVTLLTYNAEYRSDDEAKKNSSLESIVQETKEDIVHGLTRGERRKFCNEQEKCFNKSFDKAERRSGTDIASFYAFNDYRMALYAECESELFRTYNLTVDEGYKVYEESGCSVIPMPEKYYNAYYK